MTTNANLYAHFRERFPHDLKSTLLVTDDGREVTYEEAHKQSARIATHLSQLGASAGDRISVQVEKSVENLFLYLACLRSGLVYHPLNPAYTTAELEYFFANAEPLIVVCAEAVIETVKGALAKNSVKAVLTLNADGQGSLMPKQRMAFECDDVVQSHDNDIAALLYSSGTTGRPKGITLTHKNLRSNAQTLVKAWGFTASDRLLHMLPIYHVHGLFVAISCTLMSGSSMHWFQKYHDQKALEALPNCTVMMGVPTYYTRLLSNPNLNTQCAAKMRLFTSGSAPLLIDTFVEFEKRTGHFILERYGMTETGMNTSNPLDGKRRAGTVGLPLHGVEIRVVDSAGALLAAGETGNLQVKGDNVFPGYWRLPEKTETDFTDDGFFDTGDKAMVDTDGYVSIVGRAKDMIITGGLNVYPKEIELVIDQLVGVVESAVIGIADDDFGEAVVAVVVVRSNTLKATDVVAHCRSQLASFKLPKRVEFVDALPRNAMGKIQKNVLRAEFSKRDE